MIDPVSQELLKKAQTKRIIGMAFAIVQIIVYVVFVCLFRDGCEHEIDVFYYLGIGDAFVRIVIYVVIYKKMQVQYWYYLLNILITLVLFIYGHIIVYDDDEECLDNSKTKAILIIVVLCLYYILFLFVLAFPIFYYCIKKKDAKGQTQDIADNQKPYVTPTSNQQQETKPFNKPQDQQFNEDKLQVQELEEGTELEKQKEQEKQQQMLKQKQQEEEEKQIKLKKIEEQKQQEYEEKKKRTCLNLQSKIKSKEDLEHILSHEDVFQSVSYDVFSALDRDGGGDISGDELGDFISEMLGKNPAQVSKQMVDSIVKALDKNGDGVISSSEFAAFLRSLLNDLKKSMK